MRNRTTVVSSLGLMASATLVLSACGTADADLDTTPPEGEAAQGEELTHVVVGALPILPTAGLQYGIEHGIFEEYGLDVELSTSQAGSALVPALVAGDVDFGTSNTVSIMVGIDAGLPIQVTSGFVRAWDEDAGEDITGVYTLPDSGIEDAADLEDRTVAVNSLKSVGDLTIRELVRQAGGDPDKVKFVELGYPDMPAALQSGQVDAVWEVEPFATKLEESGAELVAFNFLQIAPGVPTMVMMAAQDQDPELIEQFTTALTDVLNQAQADPDGVRAILPDLLGLDPALAETVRIEIFGTDINTDAVQVFADLALKDELVSEPVDIDRFDPELP
ncbi:ABC transporter substrate-binding protein [Georgenia yuyongxinii]|uniref:PhnD/SsuA/transferrin family substrate-binding protein n=1 Tax=Georgenia yuyongxinii TaxID=2589797 RepID=A0A552WU76_9MICO|nr:ABC transporter substrate-binding protein [Georgenia yuyongxinii]TRW46266.1 PhnD/SsuA/transferrin family substrate-binding protein [Georgenia yuyongxinii]